MAAPVRVMLVDDELLAREGLRELIAEEDGFEVCAEASDGRSAIEEIRRSRPDVLMLDIQMPELDGFGVLTELSEEERPAVIFVTAYEQYAVAAFDAAAADYLLKPFDRERLREALEKAVRQVGGHAGSEGRDGVQDLLQALERRDRRYLERFVVKRQARIVLVPAEEVDWIEAAGNYVYIHVGGAQHLIRDTLTHLEQDLDPEAYVRIHRSAIVRLGAVSELERLGSGDYLVRLHGGKELTLSRSFRRLFEERLGRGI